MSSVSLASEIHEYITKHGMGSYTYFSLATLWTSGQGGARRIRVVGKGQEGKSERQ